MDASASNLSQYGYDFVVATTQASINSTLLHYLKYSDQPVNYLCFLADEDTGDPGTAISLEELLTLTNGVNPFDIPEGTDYNDPRITALTGAMFIVGIKLQMGLPPGILPRNLPSVVTLGSSATNVIFRMFCSQFTVIQNTPPGGFSKKGSWNVWSQPSGIAWAVETTVNLLMADLDQELNTPYLNKHPDIKEQLRKQLTNTSGSAFSLQQLLFDLDSAVLQSVPRFPGSEGTKAESALERSFISLWSRDAKEHGLPLVSILAVPTVEDKSPLHLSSFERHVMPLRGGDGKVITNPTALDQAATTLNYLCATEGKQLPEATTFGWNWVSPSTINDKSGVISINRNTFANYFQQLLLPAVQKCCMYPTAKFGSAINLKLTLDSTPPKIEFYPDGDSHIVRFTYYSGHQKVEQGGDGMDGTTTYTVDINVSDQTIALTQHLRVYIVLWVTALTAEANVINFTRKDTYLLEPGQDGQLNLTLHKKSSSITDDSKDLDFGSAVSGIPPWNQAKALSNGIRNVQKLITDMPLLQLPNFIFPGAQSLTYTSARFSEHQDLLCDITYVEPA